jgi:preprotein translocase subunit YajC
MLISPAYAQAAGAPAGGDMFLQFMPFILIFVIMYFLIIRPQQKRVKQHQEMVKNLKRGDTVVMSGGFIGKITKIIDDSEAEMELGDGVKVRILRSLVAEVRTKGEPANDK